MGLKHLTGIQAKQAAIIIAKEDGAIQERIMNEYELLEQWQNLKKECTNIINLNKKSVFLKLEI